MLNRLAAAKFIFNFFFFFVKMQPTDRGSPVNPTALPPGTSNSVCLPNCTRIEEEEDITDVVDHAEPTKNAALNLTAPLRTSITKGCDSPPLTPPNTLKIPVKVSDPIPIR